MYDSIGYLLSFLGNYFSSDNLDTYCDRYIGLRHEYIGFLISNAPSQSLIRKLLNDWELSNVVWYINIARVS